MSKLGIGCVVKLEFYLLQLSFHVLSAPKFLHMQMLS